MRVQRAGVSGCHGRRIAPPGIPFAGQVGFSIEYDGEPLHLTYRADFVCYEAVIVEIKALSSIGPIDEAQVLNYLKASRLKRALILNFGSRSLQWRRFVW